MAAVTVSEMRALEQAAMNDGWSEEALMNLAGQRLAQCLARHFPTPGAIVSYLGKGHNAGDALVAQNVLRDSFGWNVFARAAFPPEEWAPLSRRKWQELQPAELLPALPPWRDLPRPLVLLDGLLGIGANGALRAPLAPLAEEIAWLRQHAGARVAAVDLPSGVDPDRGEVFPGAVAADLTCMIGAAKRGLLRGSAANHTGALALIPVEPLTAGAPDAAPEQAHELISPVALPGSRGPRPFDFHKGMAGRVGILAGSEAYTGAAVLAATGALRGGAGLVTLHTSSAAAAAVRASAPPELILRSCRDARELLEPPYDALVVGPGLEEDLPGLAELLSHTTVPMVIDAEALNFLSRTGGLDALHAHHLLTPHPGEFRRLAPDLADLPREEAARAFVARHPVTLLLKGARTLVTRRDAALWHNATGSPGMATGGQGDLLSGIIGAGLASGEAPLTAAARAAWLCGRAAERALLEPHLSEESLLPTDVLRNLGGAFRDWRAALR